MVNSAATATAATDCTALSIDHLRVCVRDDGNATLLNQAHWNSNKPIGATAPPTRSPIRRVQFPVCAISMMKANVTPTERKRSWGESHLLPREFKRRPKQNSSVYQLLGSHPQEGAADEAEPKTDKPSGPFGIAAR